MSWQRYERSIDKQSLPNMFDELITEIEQRTRVVLSKVATHLTGWAAIGPCAVAVFGSLIYNYIYTTNLNLAVIECSKHRDLLSQISVDPSQMFPHQLHKFLM